MERWTVSPIVCINLLEPFQEGSIFLSGQEIGYSTSGQKRKRLSERVISEQRELTGMVFQQFNLFPHMTILKNVISDIVDEKLDLAKKMGADHIINSNAESLKDVGRSVASDGFDVIVDAVGTTPLFRQAVDLAGSRSRIICIGFDARPLDIPLDVITKKELSIIGSRMNCHRFPTVMEWLDEGKICADKMISRKYNIKQIQQAFEETIKDGGRSIKTLILFD